MLAGLIAPGPSTVHHPTNIPLSYSVLVARCSGSQTKQHFGKCLVYGFREQIYHSPGALLSVTSCTHNRHLFFPQQVTSAAGRLYFLVWWKRFWWPRDQFLIGKSIAWESFTKLFVREARTRYTKTQKNFKKVARQRMGLFRRGDGIGVFTCVRDAFFLRCTRMCPFFPSSNLPRDMSVFLLERKMAGLNRERRD